MLIEKEVAVSCCGAVFARDSGEDLLNSSSSVRLDGENPLKEIGNIFRLNEES